MEISKLDEVTALRNHRAAAQGLRKRATSELIDLRLGNEPMDAFSVISAEPIRAAVREACDAYCIEIEAKLAKLGVRVSDPTPPLDGTAEQWRRTADMFCQAWQRELRGHRPWKSHLIDSLVLGTSELVKRAANMPTRYPHTQENCPGHVSADPKVCDRCGIHIDSLRPPEPDDH